MPDVPGPAAPGRLFLGDDEGSVRFSLFPKAHGNGIGRIRLEEMVDALAKWALRQPFAEKLRRQHIGHFLDLVAAARMALYLDAERAEFFDPAPYGEAGDADFAGDLRPADHDHGVVGKQRQERVNAAVGRARLEGGLRHGHL